MSYTRYAILDTTDNCWLGDDNGPKLFEDFAIARIAAQVMETQTFGTDLGARYQAREFHAQPLRLKEKVDVRMTAVDALQRIEITTTGKPKEYIEATKRDDGWSVVRRKVQ